MVSAAEQLAKNFSFSSFTKAKELKSRIWFTLGALIVFRIGTYIPVPGVDPQILKDIFQQQQGGVLGVVNVFAGGALGRMAIFALAVMPYISASIIVQLMTSVFPTLDALKKEGTSGRQKINQYTRYLTVLLATLQGYGMAVGLESMKSSMGSAVIDPGMFFRLVAVATLVGGSIFLMWLGEQITARGIGQGISLIIFAGIVAEFPSAIFQTLELSRTGVINAPLIIGLALMVITVLTFIVFMERAHRRLLIQYPKRQNQQGFSQQQVNHLPLKLNTAGVIPAIFASSLLLMPTTIAGFLSGDADSGGFFQVVMTELAHGRPVYMILYALLIAFFCFFYTAIVFNPSDTADNLKKGGGFISGVRPGEATAEYLDYILTRLTVVGSLYMILVCLLPEFLIGKYSLPFYFGGTSLLIVVSVSMDTVGQVQSHLLAHQYDGLMKKSRLRGRKKF